MEKEENQWKQEIEPFVLTKSKDEMKKVWLDYLKMQNEMIAKLATVQAPTQQAA